MDAEKIEISFTAEPLRLTMAQRKNFKLTFSATNKGDEVINPELHAAKLFVNGQESIPWTLAISNGARETKWSALPPGETVSMSWSTLGKAMFPALGKFELVLHYFDQKLPAIYVEVISPTKK